MAINIRNTASAHVDGIKMLVYGNAGAGKTTAIKTLPNPIILSAEAGLLSLSGVQLPYIEVDSIVTLKEAFEYLTKSEEGNQFDSIALDSISEIGEVCLNYEKKACKDPRAAYGNMAEQMGDLIRSFRDIKGKHVYFSAKAEKTTDESGRVLYAPSMPGNKVGQSLPYFFDEVFALRVEMDAEKNIVRALMTQSDGLWTAKDRSGKLDMYEPADLGAIIRKISGSK